MKHIAVLPAAVLLSAAVACHGADSDVRYVNAARTAGTDLWESASAQKACADAEPGNDKDDACSAASLGHLPDGTKVRVLAGPGDCGGSDLTRVEIQSTTMNGSVGCVFTSLLGRDRPK